MKISSAFEARLVEYRYFCDDMKRRGLILLNSKLPIDGVKELVPFNENGASPEEALFEWESNGRKAPCKSPDEFLFLYAGKCARDWHITQWAEGMHDGIITAHELIECGIPKSLVESAIQARYALERTWTTGDLWEALKKFKDE